MQKPQMIVVYAYWMPHWGSRRPSIGDWLLSIGDKDSERNLRNMKRFAAEYPYFPFMQVPLAELKNENRQFVTETF